MAIRWTVIQEKLIAWEINAYRTQLETLLRNNFGAMGDDLPALTKAAPSICPTMSWIC